MGVTLVTLYTASGPLLRCFSRGVWGVVCFPCIYWLLLHLTLLLSSGNPCHEGRTVTAGVHEAAAGAGVKADILLTEVKTSHQVGEVSPT
ncbi:hypothetical protein Pmani_007520 [Petrolisthes manimaculis]|uniref:Uncharacterized protein n=1 Tax=Petrolisthes manimaculis TaxID=1843537 RepID=A0AAE1UKQ9_9EUCA|nr:hypothetical protein Pmani_007520 [Petrolisthes manimaculis]